jgi:hypothetical protein
MLKDLILTLFWKAIWWNEIWKYFWVLIFFLMKILPSLFISNLALILLFSIPYGHGNVEDAPDGMPRRVDIARPIRTYGPQPDAINSATRTVAQCLWYGFYSITILQQERLLNVYGMGSIQH